MIKFATRPQRLTALHAGSHKEHLASANFQALNLSISMFRDLGHHACEEHPEEVNLATLVVTPAGDINLVKDFCCDAFARRLRYSSGKSFKKKKSVKVKVKKKVSSSR